MSSQFPFFRRQAPAFSGVPPAVNTNYATFNGTIDATTGVAAYLGIRYGNAAERFRDPRPLPINGPKVTINATTFGPDCPQPPQTYGNPANFPQSEDCLFLNIWTPALDGKKRSVLVYIHGGAYTAGSGSQEINRGNVVASKGDVVVVTINYRVAALGFLFLSELAPGQFDSNIGLKDSILALKWVQDNIGAFGGDKNSVTLWGISAGASAAITLMNVPSAKGLFDRVIAHSPPASMFYSKPLSTKIARDFLTKQFNVTDIPSRTWVNRLKSIPANELALQTSNQHLKFNEQTRPGSLGFAPVIDGVLLKSHPLLALQSHTACNVVPAIIGTTLNETNLFQSLDPQLTPMNTNEVENLFQLNPTLPRQQILAAYEGYPSTAAFLRFTSDLVFRIPSIRVAESIPTAYFYRFDYDTFFTRAAGLGAAHSTDSPIAFGLLDTKFASTLYMFTTGELRVALSNRMIAAWTQFAKTGTPGVAGWEKYSVAKRTTLVWGENDTLINIEDRARAAWGNGIAYLE
ncbi:Carboxylesterase [Cladochytrium replicatum]|nr:Carboxylesterase [Cladochytrium replicatum]